MIMLVMEIEVDSQRCRERALWFAKRAASCASALAQARFARIAQNWMQLAFELERWYRRERALPHLKSGNPTWPKN